MKTKIVVLLALVLLAVTATPALAQGPGQAPPGAPEGWWIYKTVLSTDWDRAYEGWLNSNGWERYAVDWTKVNGVLTQVFKYRKWQAAGTASSVFLMPGYIVDQYSACWSDPGATWTPQGCTSNSIPD